MAVITKQAELEDLCARLRQGPFFTIDTEFLRDRTYYPQLCLIQVAAPEGDPSAIDPLAGTLDLAPLFELLADESLLKVFHAARQDLEIVYNLTGRLPRPLFDTQVAAMVCGYGESVGYYALVHDICGVALDKGAQFTDWSRRPLSKKQLSYALDDVTYLRAVYKHLAQELQQSNRLSWVEEEMAVLTSPATYENDPAKAWHRIKIRTDKPKTLAVLQEISAWREREAQRRDVPRNRVIRDETLADIAIHPPKDEAEMARMRGVGDLAKSHAGKELLAAIRKGLETPLGDCPQVEKRTRFPAELTPALEMLRMLLKIQCSEHDVAAKLVANVDDLESLAMNHRADIPALKGWRNEVFGREAVALLEGRISLRLDHGKIIKAA